MDQVHWQNAVKRADRIARFGGHPAASWDGRAVHGILAVTVAGLAARHGCAVAEVETGGVLWHLDQGPAAVYELGRELGLAGDAPQPAEAGAEWQWLTRPWPVAPPLANSDGLPRGIGRGSGLPAIEVCSLWACAAAREALIDERSPGLPLRARVKVTGGKHQGRTGLIASPAWLMDDERRTVQPGPPHGYEVILTVPGQDLGPRRTVLSTIGGELRLEAPGPHGEPVIIRAGDLVADKE